MMIGEDCPSLDAARCACGTGRAPQEATPIRYGKHFGTKRAVMPSVMEAPELVEYVETHDLTIETSERPQIRRARPGFWRTLAQRIATHLIPRRRERHVPSCSTHLPFETPADLLSRQHPTLYLRALCGI
jgi:hypothetical protein